MSDQIYNWKRFWCPRGGSISLSFGGYLDDPDSEWGRYSNPNVKPFGAIADTSCLILLGEPGIGKTCTIEAEEAAIKAKIQQEGGETLRLSLRSCVSDTWLVRNLFESQEFLSWLKGDHQLHLFLDSLDEGLLQINALATLLADEFKKYPCKRISLRIACRTAEWPDILETELKQLWGEKAVEVYELVPLRRVDVVEAAKANSIDPDIFLGEVERTDVVPLAIKPITLDFLLKTYLHNGNFPKTQTELYLEGCLRLCDEQSKSRRAARLTGKLSADQRLIVAARVATVTIFSNKDAVWNDGDQGGVPKNDMTVRDLSGRKESAQGNEFTVGDTEIKEVLGTGLFSARGPDRLGWAHQTYAEFLAAHYLVQHQMTLTQMLSLIVHPGDTEKKLVPQLHETAAWLASMVPEVFREIIESDPEILLRSDVATAEEANRAALVQALLEKCDAEQSRLYHEWGGGVFARFKKLAHGGLAEQLRAYICDSAKSQFARRVAIDIAEACELQALENELVQLALDQAQPLIIRQDAAKAVVHYGTEEVRAQLKSLALGEAGDDPDDELKGVGLQAIWPDHLSAEELFTLLTPPKNENFMGAYEEFLSRNLATKIRPADLPVALNWVAAQSHYNPRYQVKRLVDAIMLRAWEQIGVPGVLQSFANAALSELKHHNEILRDRSNPQSKSAFLSHEVKRRQVLETMLYVLSETRENLGVLFYGGTKLVSPKDIPWMISRLQAMASEGIQKAWAWLIERTFNRSDPSQTDAILVACQDNPILAEACTWLLKPIEIDSPEAQKARENYREEQLWQEQHDKGEPILDPPSAQRIAALLGQCESGNLEAWRLLIATMAESIYKNEYETDLTTLPGWTTADDEIRERIVAAAEQYVMERGSKTQEQPDTSTLLSSVVAAAGYKALLLILQRIGNFLSTIPREIWRKWAPIILTYPLANGTPFKKPSRKKSEREESTETGARFEEEQLQLTLITQAYQYAPEEIVQILPLLIDEQNEQHGDIFILSRIERCWDNYLQNALLMKMQDKKLRSKSLGRLLGVLLEHGVEEAKNFAEAVVHSSSVDNVNMRDQAITATCMLLIHAADAGWPIVWPAIQQDVEFGREVLSSSDVESVNIAGRFTEEQSADLYIWLVHQYPYAEDPNHKDGYVVGPRERVARFRNSLLRQLETKGTPQACAAIRRIMNELPELDLLKWTLLEAQAITRRQTWLPPNPQDILTITSNQQKRLVQSGEQLLDVLAESLQRLEKDLQGETPQGEFLWDRPEGICRPKDENAFSNYVKSHLEKDLKQRGIFANREPEIRRNMGGSPGERVDIQVDAVSKSTGAEEYDRISVVIEVKGCWHKELNHAMKIQLTDRYLNEAHCQHGLYLIGWFNCQQWDQDDSRREHAPEIDIEEARKQFDAQAKELSQAGLEIRAFVMNTALR